MLFLGQSVTGLLQKLDVLDDYLEDIQRSDVGIEVHTTINNIHTQSSGSAKIILLDIANKETVLEFATVNNIDLIHDPDGTFTPKDRFREKDSFAFSTVDKELITQIESYLTGRSIAWMLTEPVWNIQWIYKYAHRPGTSKKAFSLIGVGQEKKYTPQQMEFVRAFANKVMHAEHAREQLYFYMQLKRRAYRASNKNNDFSFELTYHLTNYSFFICSTMDIIARLLNNMYELNFGRFQSYGIEKVDFIQRLGVKRKTLADVYARKRFQSWADWMKVRRNHLAHESNLYLTPMVMRKRQPLSDDELEQKVDEAFDWNLYGSMSADADVLNMRAFVKQMLDLEHNYDEIVADMMTLEKVDKVTNQPQKYIVFPLRTIDEDFNKLGDIVARTVDSLSKARIIK